ncbi:hypothetical protein GCM10007908_03780 [Rhizobium albus]|nr:hypothetical protein GCM10007908_03780 [Rhizobium albus]
MTIEEAIAATLDRWGREPFARGSTDCDMLMADYVQMLTGKDPAAAWRGRYHDDEGAEEFIRLAGGNLALVEQGMASIGLSPVSEPLRGDVVVVDIGCDQITGLFLDPMTAMKMKRGVLRTRRFPILKAWRCV